ncbi:transmembrane protein 234 homolog isoform X1 [Neodiprion pinetum]|uniref:transmembrane protein 234 homolog isoform X1 n=1 Tax=Neodiprion pinetum TaxID=441929 RepID=UPI001EE01824|nr:transmembrane protein 234 homolog isoform X2 [Neodiprion pinetum]
MTSSIESVVYLGLAALLWGATNPFIKKGSEGLQYVKASSPCRQLAKEVVFLVTTLKYIIPFVINQCGSVLYFLALQSADLSLAVPVSNSLTFVFTAISGWFLGEEKSDRKTVSAGGHATIVGASHGNCAAVRRGPPRSAAV